MCRQSATFKRSVRVGLRASRIPRDRRPRTSARRVSPVQTRGGGLRLRARRARRGRRDLRAAGRAAPEARLRVPRGRRRAGAAGRPQLPRRPRVDGEGLHPHRGRGRRRGPGHGRDERHGPLGRPGAPGRPGGGFRVGAGPRGRRLRRTAGLLRHPDAVRPRVVGAVLVRHVLRHLRLLVHGPLHPGHHSVAILLLVLRALVRFGA